jgi:hypothetical protein
MDDMNTHTGSHDMDEITLVRAVLAPPPPPRPQVTARARQRLASRIEQAGLSARPAAGEGAIREPIPRLAPPAPRRSRRLRWAAAISGVAAAGLAGALAVTSLLPGGGQPGQGGHGRQGGLVTSERPFATLTGQPAGAFLTALATRVAQAKPATARYWCQRVTSAQLDPIGPGGQELTPAGQGLKPSPVSDYRYSIFARQVADDCFAYSKTGSRNVGGYLQDLGAQPATAKDAAAWRRDGSPAWHAWYGNGQLIPSQPGPRRQVGGKPGQEPWGNPASLPADPAKLRKVLLAAVAGPNDPLMRIAERQSGQSYAQLRNENLFGQARILLLEPLSPAVRAAAYQVLASVPGVHMKPGVTDPSGRSGTALWIGPRSGPGQIVIVDPATGMLLADEWLATGPHGVYAPGTLTQYNLWQSPGWTDRLP